MVALSHGKPVLTNLGALSEPFWKATEALALAPTAEVEGLVRLLREVRSDQDWRTRMGRAARKLYQDRLDISHTIAALRSGHSVIATSYRNMVGGVERYLQILIPGLLDRGHEVGLLYENSFDAAAETIDPANARVPSWCASGATREPPPASVSLPITMIGMAPLFGSRLMRS